MLSYDDILELRQGDLVRVKLRDGTIYRGVVESPLLPAEDEAEEGGIGIYVGITDEFGTGHAHTPGTLVDFDRRQVALIGVKFDPPQRWFDHPVDWPQSDWTTWRSVLDFIKQQGGDWGMMRRSMEKPWNYAAEAWAVGILDD